MPANNSVLALDVGGARIGVAIASLAARLPSPLVTLANDENFFSELHKIIEAESVSHLVVGLPRGLDGQETTQTKIVEAFIYQLKSKIDLPIHIQDEAVTSKQAEAELQARGQGYNKEDIDALAATYILQDWLSGQAKEA